VTAVAEGNSVVEISAGADDGIERGFQFAVYRDKSYLGRIVVVKVVADRAVAEIKKDTIRGMIRKGDHVTNRLD